MPDSIDAALAALPSVLQPVAEPLWRDFRARVDDHPVFADPELLTEAVKVWALSDFIAQACLRQPEMLADLISDGALQRQCLADDYPRLVGAALDGITSEQELGERLRRLRQREMVRIAWRDLAGHADLNEVVCALSALADACVEGALAVLYPWHCEQWGTPLDTDGNPQRLVVLGMGKLGARELNFSSDIDLIFAYRDDGETVGEGRTTTNQEFFVRLGQRLIAALDQNTAHGFVFRVDMRLRPFGSASALALSFDAMETYYQVHGREWERYALIKARPVAGDLAAGEALLKLLRPFIYRKYVDFGAFESLREMKAMIAREVARKGMENNIKLGAGGIREIEFIGQAFQLIRGGREPTLQQRRILTILEALRGFNMLPDYVVDELTSAYLFLRNSEHRIQAYADKQTHLLPSEAAGRARLAYAMGFADWPGYEKALRTHMRRVHQHFDQVFEAPQTAHEADGQLDLTGVWQGILDPEQAEEVLRGTGYGDTATVYSRIQQLRAGRAFLALSTSGRNRMNRLIPLLIGATGRSRAPDTTIALLLDLVETVARRSAYLALLVENPMALSQLVRLCDASGWIAHQLTQVPQLLDELLDPRQLYSPLNRAALGNEMRQRLLPISPEDLEEQMEALRRFKQANVLRVAAADVVEAVPLMVVSDHLTDIAEVTLEAGLDIAWNHLVGRHGFPRSSAGGGAGSGFAIIAYGKLGGIELGYGSDLDLVFLHSEERLAGTTDGERALDNPVFYARLAQRLIHILGTRTAAGLLYEVDTRLRPSGASGLMVTNTAAFNEYQAHSAWTWEHQALVRARFVAGDPLLHEAFSAIRHTTLCREREPVKLRREVREMREKMRGNLSKAQVGQFDLKQDPGGIADIEFMVQYGVLAWANAHPALTRYTDNIRILEGFAECGLMTAEEVSLLCDAFRAYRSRVHHLTLMELPALADSDEFVDFRAAVVALWQRLMESDGP